MTDIDLGWLDRVPSIAPKEGSVFKREPLGEVQPDAFVPPREDGAVGQPGAAFQEGWGQETRKLMDGQADRQRRFLASFRLAAQENPDMAARAQIAARVLGVDPAFALRDARVANALLEEDQQKLASLRETSPALYEQLQQTEFQKVAHDDIGNLSGTEGTLAAMGRHWVAGELVNERGMLGLRRALGKATEDDLDRLAEIDVLMGRNQDGGFLNSTAEILGQMAGTMPIILGAGALAAAPSVVAGPGAAVAAPTAFGYGATTATFAVTGAISMGNEYLDLMARGVPHHQAVVAAFGAGVGEGALEAVGYRIAAAPFQKAIARGVAKGAATTLEKATAGGAWQTFVKEAAKTWAGEVGTELAQEVSDFAFEQAALKGANLPTDTAGDLGQRLWDTFVQVGEGMTLLSLPGPGMHLMADLGRATAAERQAANIQAFAQQAEESKLRVRDPEGYKAAVDQLAGARGAEDFYVDGRDLEQALQQADHVEVQRAAEGAGISEDAARRAMPEGKATSEFRKKLPGVFDQMRDAVATGGRVVITPGEFGAHLARTELGTSLIPKLRYGPDGMTAAQAQETLATVQERAQEMRQTTEERAAFRDAWERSYDTVKKDVVQQLAAARRMTADEAEAGAEFLATTMATVASREGKLPDELWQVFRMAILSDSSAAGPRLQQPKTEAPEFNVWFGDSKVVDEDGKPLVMYHGTTADFTAFQRGAPSIFSYGSAKDSGGIFFTTSAEDAGYYTEGGRGFEKGARVIPAYLSIQNPAFLENGMSIEKQAEALRAAEAAGHDGAKIGDSQWVAFHPEQIKSTANRGTFDPNDPNTLLAPNARGEFLPQTLTMLLHQKANVSTFLHETAHYWLTVYAAMAANPNASEALRGDMQTLLDWFGVKDIAAWNAMTLEEQRKHHEAFAYSFEVYLAGGEAPSREVQGLFERFARWLKAFYVTVRDKLNATYRKNFGVDLPALTPEVRQVMDRLVATDLEIAQADAVRGLVPLFLSKEQSGMNDTEWADYQAMWTDHEQAASTDLSRRSLSATRWYEARRKELKLQQSREGGVERSRIRDQVAKDQAQLPVRKAQATFSAKGVAKLDRETALKLLGKATPLMRERLDPYLQDKGSSPEVAAPVLGFDSGEQMVKALANAKDFDAEVERLTDRRMKQERPDLTDPRQKDMAVESALHNELRARMVAIELQHASKGTMPWRLMLQAAKDAAKTQLDRTPLKEIRPKQFAAAEAAARREAQVHMKSNVEGAPARVTRAVRDELFQHQLARQALDASEELRKTLRGFQRLWKSDDQISKTRDMDRVQAARAILGFFGLGALDQRALVYVSKLRDYDAQLYAEIEPMLEEAKAGKKSYRDLTLREFRDLAATVDALWWTAARDREMRIGEQMVRVEQAVNESVARLGEIGIPKEVPGDRAALSRYQKFGRWLNNVKALLRRVEHWARATDGPGNEAGPFTRYIWRPISQAIDRYRIERNRFVKEFVQLLSQVELPVGKIEAKELGYTFGNGSGGIGKAELLGALLHAGNMSNLRKLLLGRWADHSLGDQDAMWDEVLPRWQAFVRRMVSEGKLTQADFNWVQSVWDLHERLKPLAQKAHHDLFGRIFWEVEATPFSVTFPDGSVATYKGGYVPAKQDRALVREAQIHQKLEDLESDFRQEVPSTGWGGRIQRVDVNRKLDLDIRKVPKALDDTIRFIYVQPAIRDVMKVLRNDQFASALTRVDHNAIEQMLIPWLVRSARQTTSAPGMDAGVDRFWSTVRKRTGMAVMFANLSNALQQVTGLFFSALKVKGSYLRTALWDYTKAPRETAARVAGMSEFMADRLQNQVFDLQDTINELTLNPGRFNKLQAWSNRHAYFLQSAFQNGVDTVTWIGAYNQALEQLGGGPEIMQEAVARADAAVRQTQGSIQPEDVAKYQAGTPFLKTISQFSGYFNMVGNLNADELISVFRDLGWKSNKARLWQVYLLGFAAPMLISDAIAGALAGQYDDEDDDGYGDELASWFFGGQARGVAALVPVAGPALAQTVTAIGSRFFGSGYSEDRMSTSPAVRALESVYGVADAAVRAVSKGEITGKQVKDVGTLLSLALGIPLSALARPVGYLTDVARDKVEPYNPIDLVRGAVTGRAAPGSRQR